MCDLRFYISDTYFEECGFNLSKYQQNKKENRKISQDYGIEINFVTIITFVAFKLILLFQNMYYYENFSLDSISLKHRKLMPE